METSFAPIGWGRPRGAAMLPAVREASEVVSRFSVAPTDAISWPFLSTRKTIFAFASLESRSQTVLICWNSSSYITIDGPDIDQPRRGVGMAHSDANRRFVFSLQLAPGRVGTLRGFKLHSLAGGENGENH